MATFRVHKETDYSVIDNTLFKDYTLSYKAKGLLAQMLSLPENWDYSIIGLTRLAKDGKDSIMKTLDELEGAGYLVMDKKRNDRGQFETSYDVYESPNREIRCGKSESGNPPQYNNKEIKEESINKENINPTPLSPKGKSHKVLDLSFVDREDFIPIMEQWLAYKKEKGQTYKPTGLRTCYKKLVEYSNGNAEKAKQIIEEAMSNNYSGFFPLKQQTNGNNNRSNIQYGNPLYKGIVAEMERELGPLNF